MVLQTVRTLAALALVASAIPSQAQQAPPPAAGAPAAAAPAAEPLPPFRRELGDVEWRSMSRAKVTAGLPPEGPMATDLVSRTPPPAWADVPSPPPPAAAPARAAQAKQAAAAPAKASAAPAPMAFLPPEGSAPAGSAPAVYEAPAAGVAAGSERTEPKVTVAADHTGVMVEARQNLESDKVRQSWAARGGKIGAFEAGAGLTLMGLSTQGMTMTGVGISGNFGAALLSLTPPSYERRDRSWFATKLGVGLEMGAIGITITTPVTCAPYVGCYGGNSSASMTSMTLTSSLGIMKAFGSFDSPSEWSGWAIGAEWSPSYQSTSMSMEGAPAQTESRANWTGFALNIERGSMAAMAGKMGKQAHVKMRFFLLPPVSSDTPFFMTFSVGAVWY